MNNKQRRNKKPSTVSFPVAVFSDTLNTDYAQKVDYRHMQRVGGSLYQITILGRKLGAGLIPEEPIKDLENQIEESMKALRADMQTQIDKTKKIAGEGVGKFRMTYTHPKRVDFQISTPLQHMFLELILKLDELCMTFDSAVYLGKMDPSAQVSQSFKWRTAVESAASQIITTASNFSSEMNMIIENSKNQKQKPRHKAHSADGDVPEETASIVELPKKPSTKAARGKQETPIAVSSVS